MSSIDMRATYEPLFAAASSSSRRCLIAAFVFLRVSMPAA
jgi:hypothetical protein